MYEYFITLISAREKLLVCDVTNLPYMDTNLQSISIYGYFVPSLTAYYPCADIELNLRMIMLWTNTLKCW